MIPFGVYVGKDAELVAADKHIIAFRRIHKQNCLESCLLRKDASSEEYLCVGICRSYPIHIEANSRPRYWKYGFSGQRKAYANDEALSGCLRQPILKEIATENGIAIQYWDGQAYTAAQDELFTMQDIHPHSPAVSAENIGECLRCWNMNCFEETIEANHDTFVGVTINTAKHMYIFQMTPSSFYCRAARYATCNRGVLFCQNFRQRKGPMPETYMAEDNLIALQPLSVEERDFDTFACSLVTPEVIAQKYLDDQERKVIGYRYGVMGCEKLSQRKTAMLLGISPSSVARIAGKAERILFSHMSQTKDNGIYWIVESFTDNRIILHGCQGDVYQWDKPER